jgi:hypothetical protein
LATGRSFDEMLFGEPLEKITCNKLLEVLQSVQESPAIEFKTWVREVGEKDRGYEEDNKSIILKSVSAFLNSPNGRGLLVIGARGKERFEGVECIPRDERFRSREAVEAFIRETIFSHIKALPDYKVPPLLKVKVFSCREDCGLDQDGWLAAIYIERRADSLYYYSVGGKDRAYIREGSRSRELRIDEMLQIIERKRRAIIVTILNPRIIDDHTIELEVLVRNIGSKPAMYLYTLLIIKRNVDILLPQGVSKAYIEKENIMHDTLSYTPLSKMHEGQNDIIFNSGFGLNLPWIIPSAIFPYLDTRISKVRLGLRFSLPSDAVKVLIPFESLTLAEDTVTLQSCLAMVAKNDVNTQCSSVIVKDYLGVSVLQSEFPELKALPMFKDAILSLKNVILSQSI